MNEIDQAPKEVLLKTNDEEEYNTNQEFLYQFSSQLIKALDIEAQTLQNWPVATSSNRVKKHETSIRTIQEQTQLFVSCQAKWLYEAAMDDVKSWLPDTPTEGLHDKNVITSSSKPRIEHMYMNFALRLGNLYQERCLFILDQLQSFHEECGSFMLMSPNSCDNYGKLNIESAHVFGPMLAKLATHFLESATILKDRFAEFDNAIPLVEFVVDECSKRASLMAELAVFAGSYPEDYEMDIKQIEFGLTSKFILSNYSNLCSALSKFMAKMFMFQFDCSSISEESQLLLQDDFCDEINDESHFLQKSSDWLIDDSDSTLITASSSYGSSICSGSSCHGSRAMGFNDGSRENIRKSDCFSDNDGYHVVS